MVKIRKYANGIERFLHGEKGQRFFNFAYSIGAAIVIWGALFKILHLPGGSTLLCIGMGTEIAMFILTAFDRPPKEYAWEDVFPVLIPVIRMTVPFRQSWRRCDCSERNRSLITRRPGRRCCNTPAGNTVGTCRYARPRRSHPQLS